MSQYATTPHTPRASRMATLEGRILLWTVTVCLLAVVVYLQRPEPTDPKELQESAAGLGEIRPEKGDMIAVFGKLALGMKSFSPPQTPGAPTLPNPIQQMLDEQVGLAPASSPFGGTMPKPSTPRVAPAADRLRVAIIAGETIGPAALLERLDATEPALDAESPLREDAALLRALHAPEASGAASETLWPDRVAALDPDLISRFKQRHGLFADIALQHGEPNSPARAAAAQTGISLLLVLGIVGAAVGVALMVGVVLLIVGTVQWWGGKLTARFQPPAHPSANAPHTSLPDVGFGGDKPPYIYANLSPVAPALRAEPGWRDGVHRPTVYLETVAVFLAGFLSLKLAAEIIVSLYAGNPPAWLGTASLLGQWSLVALIFWPVARGMTWQRWRGEVGWHRGQGIAREIGAGFLAYLAGLPIYFGMAFLLVLGMFVYQYLVGGEAEPPPSNKIFELVAGGGIWSTLLIFSLATIWAPFTEETIFRGCLYRHLRGRLPVIVAALGSAFVFAVLHGYMAIQLVLVGVLGFNFALMREWRGSLIGSIFAHALHNGMVMALLVTLLSIASG